VRSLTVAGAAQAFDYFLDNLPVSRLTLVNCYLPRAPKNITSIYNVSMSELTNQSLNRLQESLARLESKTKALQEAVSASHQQRLALEAKIEDAQTRIQNILSKLPPQDDGRQMDLLSNGGVKDDHEPTSH
jgi:division protein CdvB (Snf7/Vps24/ESCRT-III family)